MAGSKAFFSLDQCITEYTKPGTDARQGAEAFERGDTLNVNDPAQKADLRGVVAFFKAAAAGIERDGHLDKR